MASSTESLPSQSSNQASTLLETVVSHLLASKRSLSSINHVYRANELVTATRNSLETSVITSARTEFLRTGIDSQVRILTRVRNNIEGVAREGAAEFKAVIRNLDTAEERLRETLNLLRKTMVEASLRPEDEGRRSLLDFVDETGVDGLMARIKTSIDKASGADDDFSKGNRAFDEDVQNVKSLLAKKTKQDMPGEAGGETKSPIPEILHDMEDHAKDMADNLESLVRHFDLCVTAIKHTEGGGDAAQRIAGEWPEGVDIGQDGTNAPADPIGEEERREMMEVLEKDASQVEDVVIEIKEHMMDMEARYELVTAYTDQLADEHANTTSAFRLLEEIGLRLPGYIAQSHIFVYRWDDEKATIEECMDELEGLRLFYDGFLRAYDNLLLEIGRRKALETRMEKVAQDAMAKIQKLYEDDFEERESFKKAQGDFLPVDIWPGLMAGPLQYEILPVGNGVEKVPDVSKSVIQQATRRVDGRI
ncbi:autophagy protein 17 [Sticta canariensis]|nr:autophagy protein 17 [Sticta canariensis]